MKKILLIVVSIIIFAVGNCYAQSSDVLEKVSKSDILKRFLSLTNGKILEARDIASLYEVVVEQNNKKGVLYLTKDDMYLIFGAVVDKEGKNIARDRMEEISKVDFSSIPVEDALVFKQGNGSKKLVMITDVDCPFCRKAMEWLNKQTDYTLYAFLYPLDIHPEAYEKSVKILCSEDKTGALKSVKAGNKINTEKCKDGEDRLKKHILVGQILQTSGTPLFVLDSGKKISGFNQAELEKYMEVK